MKKNRVGEIIQIIKDIKGIRYDYEVAEALGISEGKLSTAKHRNTLTFWDELIAFGKKENILEKLLDSASPISASKLIHVATAHGPWAPYLNIWGVVGAGDAWDYNMQEVTPKELEPKERLVVDELFQNKITDCFRVRGYSMFPVLRPNALIGVDFKDKKLVGSELFVLNLAHEGLSVKEVWPEGKRTRVHSYRSEIPDFYFEEEEVDDTVVVGRVVWIYQDTDG